MTALGCIPPNGRKSGRPVDPELATYRRLFPDWSERTLARYVLSMRRLRLIGTSYDDMVDVISKVTRPNGTLNVAKLDEITESKAAMYLARLPEIDREVAQ